MYESVIATSFSNNSQCRDGRERERDTPGAALRVVSRPSKCSRWLSTLTEPPTAAAPHSWAIGASGGANRGGMCGLICSMQVLLGAVCVASFGNYFLD